MAPKGAVQGSKPITKAKPSFKLLATILEGSGSESDPAPSPAYRKASAKTQTPTDSESEDDDSDVDIATDSDAEGVETEVEASQDGEEEPDEFDTEHEDSQANSEEPEEGSAVSDDGAVVAEEEDVYVPFRIRCAFRIHRPPKAGKNAANFCKKWASRPIDGNPLLYCHLHYPKPDQAGWPANPRKRRDLNSYEGRLRKNDPNAPEYGKRGQPVGSKNM